MCLEVTRLYAGVVALDAVERLFSRMISNVCLEVTSLCAGELTYLLVCSSKGFSPEWVSMCVLRLPAVVQEKLHCLQAKELFPI